MNWYKNLKKYALSITDLAYDEWKKTSFKANVGTIIYRIYQIGVPANAKKHELGERVDQVIKELSKEDGELRLWHKVINDTKYFNKIKSVVKKQYKSKVKEIEKAKNGPLQINTPQTPTEPSGGGGGGMLM